MLTATLAPPLLSAELLDDKGLTPAGQIYVMECASPLPARKVGCRQRKHNLILEVPFPEWKIVLQAESLTGEYAFLVRQRRRTDLVMILDQPCTVPLEIVDRRGRATRTTYTADYLLLEVARVVAAEVRADGELRQLLADRPADWTFDGERYHYLPAERYFGSLGIYHVVVATSELSALVTSNLQLLTLSRKAPELRGYAKARRGLMELLQRVQTARVGELLDRMDTEDATPLLQLIDRGELFVDLERVVLSPTSIREVWISTNPRLASLAQQSTQQLRELLLGSKTELDGSLLTSPREELEIATRLAIITGTTLTDATGEERSLRSRQRYRRQYDPRDIRSLGTKYANCGSGTPLHTNHVALIQAWVRQSRADPGHPSVRQAYRCYKEDFDENRSWLEITDRKCIVLSTFYEYWARTPSLPGEAYGKGGRRHENVQADTVDAWMKSLPATRPFQVAHIDHWKADFHLQVAQINGKRYTRRPWLTCMVDSYSGEVLAFWLSFRNPSRRACTMVIRDCVRRHGRLPEMIVTDGGAEFKSAHFLVMLATLEVVRCERPPEDPRYGKEVERVFGQFKERFARGLPGYGISIAQARAVSAAFSAPRRATLSLMDAIEVLEAWIFNGYNQMPKPGTTIARADLREQGLRTLPGLGVSVPWDLKFLIATSIPAPGKDYVLWKGRGIHLLDKWYSSPALLRYRGYKKDFVVRVEPFCDAVIYVRIDGKWLVCARQDVTQQLAMTDRWLLSSTCERHELSALRREIQGDADTAAARIVNRKLAEIAARTSSQPETAEPVEELPDDECGDGPDDPPGDVETGPALPFDFEDIASLPEEDE